MILHSSDFFFFCFGFITVFKYIPGQHNAYEVIEATYKSCNDSTGVLVRYASGDDQVVLKEVKRYWFICTINGHCLGGMRFTIEVKEASTAPSGAPPETEPSPPATTTPDKGFASREQAMATYCLVFAFGVVVVLQIVLF